MANSDNVLRGGLTPKHVDVPELLRILDFHPVTAAELSPETIREGTELRYATPAPEFAVSVFDIDGAALGGEIDAPCRHDGPQILVCTAGAVTVRSKTQTLELARGAAAWVAADGGPLVWPTQISFLQAKEFALTGAKIPAAKALELGLANHVVADPVAAALECARGILKQPQQAVEATKRLMNMQLERSVTTSLDYANLSEYVSFGTADFNRIVDGLIAKK